MSEIVNASQTQDGRRAATAVSVATTRLLWCGVAASPLWLLIVLAQMLFRSGFDIRRQAISLLLLGDYGWIQALNYVVVGLLIVAGAIGLWRAMHPGRAGTWGPALMAVFGLALIAAAFFVPDAADGFPPGAPETNVPFSTHGALHALFSSVSFLAFAIAAAFVLPRRFLHFRQPGWAIYSIASAACFLSTWVALFATAWSNQVVNLAFAVGILIAWLWMGVIPARVLAGARRDEGLSASA